MKIVVGYKVTIQKIQLSVFSLDYHYHETKTEYLYIKTYRHTYIYGHRKYMYGKHIR